MSDSLITKRALAKTLKELCQYRNFEKISINDLTNKCGLNRQTFYYHFQDKYDLLQWLYYNLAQKCFYDAITKLDVNKTVSPQEKNFFSEFYAYGIAGTVLRWIKTNMKNEPAKLAHGLKKIATQSETFAASLLNN